MDREEALRLLYLYLAAVYAALASYTVWEPFWLWAARYAAARGSAALAGLLQLLPYALAAASFVLVLAYAPAVALALVAFGAAVGGVAGANTWLPLVLALGSSILYGLATRPRPAGVEAERAVLAKVAAVEAASIATAAAAAASLAPLLAGLASVAPPSFLPDLARRAWSALASTMAGRLTVYGLAVAALASISNRLGRQALLLASPRLAARELHEMLQRRLLPGRGLLAEALGQASLLASLVYGVSAAYTVWALASQLAMSATTTAGKAAILGLAAGASWIAYAASKRLVEYMLLGRPRWGLLAALGAATLASMAVFAALQGYSPSDLFTARADPLAGLSVEERLRRLYETLEAQLRLIATLLWG